jgi:hypothetical protein
MRNNPFWLLLLFILITASCYGENEPLKEINASVLSRMISGEGINLDNVIIQGDIVHENLKKNGKGIIFYPINITNSRINGKIIFQGCEFKNTFNLSNTTINGTGDFSESRFDTIANFISTQFNGTASFGSTEFMDDAYFNHAKFAGDITNFENAYFDKKTGFRFSEFDSQANFFNTYFNDTASFRSAKFNAIDSDFSRSKFKKDADFAYSNFTGVAIFRATEFLGDINFKQSWFKEKADFSSGGYRKDDDFFRFPGKVRFSGCTFLNDANFPKGEYPKEADFSDCIFNKTEFSDSKFMSELHFERSIFKGNANFKNCQFNRTAKFLGCNFQGDVHFDESKFSDDAIFDGASFERDLYLIRTKYDRFYIRWNSISEKGKLGYNETAYQLLIDNFKKLGFIEDANDCYYAFMVDRFLHCEPPTSGSRRWLEATANASSKSIYGLGKAISGTHNRLGRTTSFAGSWNRTEAAAQISGGRKWTESAFIWLIDLLLWHLNGYGKKPANPLMWSIGLVIIFTIIWLCISLMKKKDVDEYNPPNSRSNIFRMLIDEFRFSSTLFLSGTKLFVDPPKLPEETGKISGVKFIYYTERILGALFSFLFFVAITGMIIR